MSQRSISDYLGKALIDFPADANPDDAWTVDDATRGVSILGATGSGKTSASGRTLALKYLSEGWGGVVLTVKPDEASLWQDYCEETNRLNDLLMFGNNATHTARTDKEFTGQPMVFNPLDYELQREGDGGGDTQNIINIFMNIYRMGNRIAQEGDISKEERFWDSALKRCIGKVIELLKLADEPLTMQNIYNILLSCSAKDSNGLAVNSDSVARCATLIQGKSDDERYGRAMYYCAYCIALADIRLTGLEAILPEHEYAYQETRFHQVVDYFLQFLNSISEKTKSTIIEMFMGLCEPFLSGILNRHFSGRNNVKPESTFTGKIIILNFPVKEYLDVGIIAQCVFKLMYQQAVERRRIEPSTKPVFLWADEAHMFINPYDQLFLTTARSAMCSTVYLTQSISNYLAVMGSGSDSKSKVDSLLGNLTTKIFHANSDAETNEYASRLIGQEVRSLTSISASQPLYTLDIHNSESITEQYLPQIQPKKFTTLLTGGVRNNHEVEAVIFVMGKTWSNGLNYLKTFFKQSF